MRSGAGVMRRQPSLFGSFVARLLSRLLSDCFV